MAFVLTTLFLFTGCGNTMPIKTESVPPIITTPTTEEVVPLSKTILEIESGKVFVNGQEAKNQQGLQEKDVIRLEANASANILFFDDSVSRLKGGTEVSLKTLEDANYLEGESLVVMDLHTGEVWAKVQTMTSPDIGFEIQTKSVNAAIRGTVIDVSVQDKETTILAAEHGVDLFMKDPVSQAIIEQKGLIEGEKVAVMEQEAGMPVMEIKPIEAVDKQKNWFKSNLLKDKHFMERIREKRQKKRKSLLAKKGILNKREQVERLFLQAMEAFEKDDSKVAEQLFKTAQSDLKKLSFKEQRIVLQNLKRMARGYRFSDKGYVFIKKVRELSVETAPEEVKSRFIQYQQKRDFLVFYDWVKTKKLENRVALVNDFRKQLGTLTPRQKRMLKSLLPPEKKIILKKIPLIKKETIKPKEVMPIIEPQKGLPVKPKLSVIKRCEVPTKRLLACRKNCDGTCKLDSEQEGLRCFRCEARPKLLIDPSCPSGSLSAKDCRNTCGSRCKFRIQGITRGERLKCYYCKDEHQEDTQEVEPEDDYNTEALIDTPWLDEPPSEPLTCEDQCSQAGYLSVKPDFTNYIESRLNSVSCVSGYQIQTSQITIGNCLCYSNTSPTITFNQTVPICKNTICGDVACGDSKTCSTGQTQTTTTTCNWRGWKKTGNQQYQPEVGN